MRKRSEASSVGVPIVVAGVYVDRLIRRLGEATTDDGRQSVVVVSPWAPKARPASAR